MTLLFLSLLVPYPPLVGPGTAWAAPASVPGEALSGEVETLARQGDAEACFALGLALEHGAGRSQDPRAAARWFERAASGGVAGAALYLGMKYETGNGVEQDLDQAARWYRQAARAGWDMAAFLLGSLLLRRGDGDPARRAEARDWLEQAAAGGYPGAAEALAGAGGEGGNGGQE